MNTRKNERNFLATILVKPTYNKMLGYIDESYFSDERLQTAYNVLYEMWQHNEQIGFVTFEARWSERVPDGDISDLINFASEYTYTDMIQTDMTIMRDGAVKRQTETGLKDIYDQLQTGARAETVITEIDSLSRNIQTLNVATDLPERRNVMSNVTNQIAGQTNIKPILTGLAPIDEHGGYLYDTMLVAARYGVGKTPYALRILKHHCVDQGRPGVIYSGENRNEMVVMSLMAMMTGIPIRSIKMVGQLPDAERKILQEAQEQLLDAPLYFCNWGRKNFYQLKSEFAHFKNKYDTELHIIDAYPHVQLDSGLYRRKVDMLDDLADKTFALKQDIPGFWMVLDQLRTKNVEDTPTLRDVMHSSKFEQNADIGQTIDRKDKEKRRLDRERQKLSWKIKDINNDPTRSDEQKTIDVYELQRHTVLGGFCSIAQEKGRMGYGEWHANVGFDDLAYGFYDETCIRSDDPRRDELINRLAAGSNNTMQKDEPYDPEDF